MKLSDLRRFAVRTQTRVRFQAEGLECLVDEHGVGRVPGLQGRPDFNLEQALAQAESFVLEELPARPPGRPVSRPLSRERMEALVANGGAAAPRADPAE